MSKHPAPWQVGTGYEQLDPGVYISDAKGMIVYSDDVPLTEELAKRIVEALNNREAK